MAWIYIHFLGWIYDLDIYPKIWKLIISYPYPKIPLISLSGDGMFLVFITLMSEVCALRAQNRLIMEKNDMNENIALLILQWWENNLRDWYSWNHLYINSTRCENKIYLANGALIDFLLEDSVLQIVCKWNYGILFANSHWNKGIITKNYHKTYQILTCSRIWKVMKPADGDLDMDLDRIYIQCPIRIYDMDIYPLSIWGSG